MVRPKGFRTIQLATASQWHKRTAYAANSAAKRRGCSGRINGVDVMLTYEVCGNRCLHCGRRERLSIDHVIPLSAGGENAATNLQILCRPCNSIKSTGTTDYRTASQRAVLARISKPKPDPFNVWPVGQSWIVVQEGRP